MSDFHIYLPSNTTFLESNKPWEYVTKLAREITLNGEWECALTEIQYKRTWFSIIDGENMILVRDVAKNISDAKSIPAGSYIDEFHLIEVINEILSSYKIDFQLNKITRKLKILIPYTLKLYFGEGISHTLGLGYTETVGMHPVCYGKLPMDLTRGIDSMYVYTDIIQTKLVGDSCVPLLRIVPVKGKFGDDICREYNSPLYSPIAKHNFSTIEMYLRDSAGRPIPFTAGKVTVLLHFRKQK